MLSLFFIALAAIFNSAMDMIDHEYQRSIFKNKNYWYKNDWRSKYIHNTPAKGIKTLFWKIPLPSFMWNGWYMYKTLMIICIILAVFSGPITLMNVFVSTIIWTLAFESGYGFIFRLPFYRKDYFKNNWNL